MAARVIQTQNEDGVLEVSVEYYTPLPRTHISKAAKDEFERLADHATTRIADNIACVFCGADSQFRTDNGYVCEEHLLSTGSWQEATRI
jgi:hypothetical protein